MLAKPVRLSDVRCVVEGAGGDRLEPRDWRWQGRYGCCSGDVNVERVFFEREQVGVCYSLGVIENIAEQQCHTDVWPPKYTRGSLRLLANLKGSGFLFDV